MFLLALGGIGLYMFGSSWMKKKPERVNVSTETQTDELVLDMNPDVERKLDFDWRTSFDQQMKEGERFRLTDKVAIRPSVDQNPSMIFGRSSNNSFEQLMSENYFRGYNPVSDVKSNLYMGSNYNTTSINNL